MRRINVIKPFNFLHPDGTLQRFGVGIHEAGAYKKPVWDRAKDSPVEGEFTEHEIAEHPYVQYHCGSMPSREELLAEAESLRAQAEAMSKQSAAEASAGGVKPNSRSPVGEQKPNSKS